jgi:hypothetical protein
MGIFCVCGANTTPPAGKIKKEERFVQMKKLLSVVLALLMLAVMLPVTAMADDANYCTIEGVNGKFDTLTAAAKAWRESKGVVTEGNTLGANKLGTVESIVWDIYGTVPVGDGAGVAGDNGAGDCIFTGGYFTPAVTVSKVTVTGHNNATISKTNDKYRVSVNANEVVFANITFEDTMRNDSNPGSLTFTNCTFKAGLRMPHARDNSTLKVENCVFTGSEENGYAIFVQGNLANVAISGNQISNAKCGMNIQTAPATVSITGNTITNLTGKDANGGKYGSAIQLTSGASFTVTDNIINITNGLNAFQLYEGLTAEVTISNNKVTADYLIWNQAPETTTISSADNTLNIKNANLANAKGELVPDETVINKAAPTQIVIITPTGDTPKTDDQKNPTTGANDMVAAAAALMAVSALGMAVLSRKE